MTIHALRGLCAPSLAILVSVLLIGNSLPAAEQSQRHEPLPKESIVRKIHGANERMEMTVNTSRILKLDKKIPQAQVNNPDVLEITPLSPTEVQVFAKAAGVTQVNLWDEDKKIYTVDVIVYGDAQELTMILRSEFPNAAIRIKPMASGVLISGYVDKPEHVTAIQDIAAEFYPKVLNNITVSGVHQVLLHVKVMEVSRTKMRSLGFDFAKLTNGANLVSSSAAGLLVRNEGVGPLVTNDVLGTTASQASGSNFFFQVLSDGSGFFGVLEAMRQDNLLKVMAEPTLVTISGRPAYFESGGKFPILVPQSLGTVSIKYKPYGTRVDFVPIVLGNGRIRLEVRPRVSEIDSALGIVHEGLVVPALKSREVDTGVEMQAGQTLAIAGLIQNRIESQRNGIPWASDLPWIGALFRRVEEKNNEIELLMLVTPEIVEAMDPCQVPPCGPGMKTTSPTDVELGLKGHIEVPNCPAIGVGADCPAEPVGVVGQLDTSQTGPTRPGSGGNPGSGGEAMILKEVEPIPTPKADTNQRHNRSNRQTVPTRPDSSQEKALPGFIGPIGYDVAK